MIRGLRVPVRLTSRDALRIFDLADIWAARTGQEVRLVSANDHVHSQGSAHYQGEALDFHSSDPDGLSWTLRIAGYRVLWKVPGHYGHLHVEHVGPVDDFWPPIYQAKQMLRAPSTARTRASSNTGG